MCLTKHKLPRPCQCPANALPRPANAANAAGQAHAVGRELADVGRERPSERPPCPVLLRGGVDENALFERPPAHVFCGHTLPMVCQGSANPPPKHSWLSRGCFGKDDWLLLCEQPCLWQASPTPAPTLQAHLALPREARGTQLFGYRKHTLSAPQN